MCVYICLRADILPGHIHGGHVMAWHTELSRVSSRRAGLRNYEQISSSAHHWVVGAIGTLQFTPAFLCISHQFFTSPVQPSSCWTKHVDIHAGLPAVCRLRDISGFKLQFEEMSRGEFSGFPALLFNVSTVLLSVYNYLAARQLRDIYLISFFNRSFRSSALAATPSTRSLIRGRFHPHSNGSLLHQIRTHIETCRI
ncbi:hypothetical protein ABW21_db0200864 [Orbilia brochopaga]|nr:hypothetical protein ABW21_db0200864 [Drechslerella brochopaga]